MDKHLLQFLDETPYAKNYGTQLVRYEPSVECLTPWAENFTGNPLLQAWHGGVIIGVLELTGALQALKVSADTVCPLLSANINFLRPTKGDLAVRTRAYLVRSGRQILNIDVIAWQVSLQEPTAAATLAFARRS
ncbi:PaaI family thioesterase [Haliea atlantica]